MTRNSAEGFLTYNWPHSGDSCVPGMCMEYQPCLDVYPSIHLNGSTFKWSIVTKCKPWMQVDSWFLDERQARFREPDSASPMKKAFESSTRSPRSASESPTQQGWPQRRDDELYQEEESPYQVNGRPVLGSLEMGDGPAPSGLLSGQPRWAQANSPWESVTWLLYHLAQLQILKGATIVEGKLVGEGICMPVFLSLRKNLLRQSWRNKAILLEQGLLYTKLRSYDSRKLQVSWVWGYSILL